MRGAAKVCFFSGLGQCEGVRSKALRGIALRWNGIVWQKRSAAGR